MSTPISSAFPRTADWNQGLYGAGVTVGSDIIYPACRMIRLVRAGQGLQPEKVTEALAALNAMLDGWNTERLAIPATLRTLFTLVGSQAEYTIGPSGDWVTSIRPTRITRGSVIDASNPSDPIEIALEIFTLQRWQDVTQKSLTSTLPKGLYYNEALSMGNGTVTFYPIPTSANDVALYLLSQLTQFRRVEDSFELPQGYLEAIQSNLAVRLAATDDKAVLTPIIVEMARTSKARIKRANVQVQELRCDLGILGGGGRRDIRLG